MGTQVLLVEDELIIQKVHTIQLQKKQCEVDVATNGSDALLKTNQRYDIIFMDVGLPDMSGIEVIKKIRAQKNENQETPIVVLTAYASQDVRNQCLAAGAQAVYTKPVLPESFLEIMDTFR